MANSPSCGARSRALSSTGEYRLYLPMPRGAWDRDGGVIAEAVTDEDAALLVTAFGRAQRMGRRPPRRSAGSPLTPRTEVPDEVLRALPDLLLAVAEARQLLNALAYRKPAPGAVPQPLAVGRALAFGLCASPASGRHLGQDAPARSAYHRSAPTRSAHPSAVRARTVRVTGRRGCWPAARPCVTPRIAVAAPRPSHTSPPSTRREHPPPRHRRGGVG